MLRPADPLESLRLVLRPAEPGDLEELFAFHVGEWRARVSGGRLG